MSAFSKAEKGRWRRGHNANQSRHADGHVYSEGDGHFRQPCAFHQPDAFGEVGMWPGPENGGGKLGVLLFCAGCLYRHYGPAAMMAGRNVPLRETADTAMQSAAQLAFFNFQQQ
jgi:hypothetical protein